MKKIFIDWSLKLFLIIFLFQTHTNSFAKESVKQDDYYIIPIEFINNSPYITVTVENKKVKLILDTGASTAIYLRKHILNDLKNKKYTGKYDSSMDSGGNIQKMPFFSLGKAEVAHYQVSNVLGIVYKPWGVHLSEGNNDSQRENIEDGVIGLKFFQKNNLIIDYPKKRMIILKPGAMHSDYSNNQWNSSPLSTSGNTLTLQAVLEGRPYKFLIDTGSTGSVLKKAILSDKKTRNKNKMQFNKFLISGKNFGPINFWMYDLNADFDGLLGHDFFSENVIYLDFHNSVIKISKM